MIDISPKGLRQSYLEGKSKPSDITENVLDRLNHESQEAVWISTVDRTAAIKAARQLDERIDDIDMLPLYGLPFSVKDCIDVAGVPTTCACPEFSYTPKESSPVVARAIETGAIYIGKTNLDQFATGLVGVRSPYGVPKNPHNADYIPGGSSSGAAVSVATGTSSFALGTDTGGSGRIPASYCGVTGLKPAPGALSRRGMTSACRSFDTISIYAEGLEDALNVLEALVAYDDQDYFSTVDYGLEAFDNDNSNKTTWRIAVPRESDLQFFGNRETKKLFSDAVQHAETVFGAPERIDFSSFLTINDYMFFGPFVAERYVSVGPFLEANPNAGIDIVRNIILGGLQQTAVDAYTATYQVAETRRRLEKFWLDHDALLVPTVGTVVTVEEVLADPLTPNFNNGYYTNFANPLGLASISVPFEWTEAGVPYGVTFLGEAASEARLTKIAADFLRNVDAKNMSKKKTLGLVD